MSNDFEQQWAVALKKSASKAKVPIGDRKNNIIQKIKLKKEQFKTLIKNKQKPQVEALYKELIYLRAEFCAFQITQDRKNYGRVDKKDEIKQINSYTKDCINLYNIINSLP